jgi:hypothetical protein
VKSLSEFFIFAGVADETGIELDGLPNQRPHVGNEILGNTCSPEKNLGDITP